MRFETFADFLAMGGHGAYVFSAYGVVLVMLAWNVLRPLVMMRQVKERERRRHVREAKLGEGETG